MRIGQCCKRRQSPTCARSSNIELPVIDESFLAEIFRSINNILDFVIEHREISGLPVFSSTIGKHYDETRVAKGFRIFPIRRIETESAMQEHTAGCFCLSSVAGIPTHALRRSPPEGK